MKYFTYELWKSFNSLDEIVRKKANDEWKANIELYKEEFKKVESRFTKSFLKVLRANDYFHDFSFNGFEVQQNNKNKFSKVMIKLTNGDRFYEIIYNDVRKVNVDYSADANELGFGNGFCSYGYNEFLEVSDKLLSHEILFSSGATILIWFTKVNIIKT